MNPNLASCPKWLTTKISEMGGTLSFYNYMQIVLNDPHYGFYGSGKANIGIGGDFVTSPSLSEDFAFLLAKQVLDWLNQISNNLSDESNLSIVEFGSGDGRLLKGIIRYFHKYHNKILEKISFKIIEQNHGMIKKQKKNLKEFIEDGIQISWLNLDQIEVNSIDGIVLAHEVLDAFPVERVQYHNGEIYRQGITLDKSKTNLEFQRFPLPKEIKIKLYNLKNNLGIDIPPENVPEGWTTELQIDNLSWLQRVNQIISNGILLIIDYALEAKNYYSSKKIDGTLVAYKDQKAYFNPLVYPGDCDLTSHLCSEILIYEAQLSGFKSIGNLKQGEALLALGLAEKLFQIQDKFKNNLSLALLKREALLRLVDPICLGNLRWFIFNKMNINFTEIKSICIR